MTSIRELFAANLAEVMFEKEISQSKLAELSGISERTIRRYLTCQTEPKIGDLEAIASALQTSRLSLLV